MNRGTIILIIVLALVAADLIPRVLVIVGLMINPPAPAKDPLLDLASRQQRLRSIIDIACASPGIEDTTCEWLYARCRDDARALELWESMAVAGPVKYDPWDVASPMMLQYRIKQWLRHPGFPKNC